MANRNPGWETKTSPHMTSVAPLPLCIEAGLLSRPSAAVAQASPEYLPVTLTVAQELTKAEDLGLSGVKITPGLD